MTTSKYSTGTESLAPRSALPLRRLIVQLFWRSYDARDFIVEAVGWLPSHGLHFFLYRHVLCISIGQGTSIHRNCRFYRPSGVASAPTPSSTATSCWMAAWGCVIGDNVSISEGVAIFTLEHDPNSPDFANRGAAVRIDDYVFIGARAIILPGVTVGRGAVVAAGAVVTHDVRALHHRGRGAGPAHRRAPPRSGLHARLPEVPGLTMRILFLSTWFPYPPDNGSKLRVYSPAAGAGPGA